MDPKRWRKDFPLLRTATPPAYFDNACTSLKPQTVIDAVRHYYEATPVCAGRSVHRRAAEVTRRVEAGRAALARFVGAKDSSDVAFTKNATESINIVASGLPWRKGDVVITTDKEHNSNWLPWLRLQATKGVKVVALASRPDGTLDEAAAERAIREAGARLRLLSMVHASNADGVVNPLRALADLAHAQGALVLADAAQSVPHHGVDVASLGADFVAASVHKMLGPAGVGFLWGRRDALESLEPMQLGGNTVKRSGVDDYELNDLPHRFEAGLQNYAGLVGVEPAVDYLTRVGPEAVRDHERSLNQHATKRLEDIEAVTVYGPRPEDRGGILPFNLGDRNPHEVALYLDEAADVAVRSGAHCVNSYFERRGIAGWVRASFYFYNTTAEVDRFADAVDSLAGSLARGRTNGRPAPTRVRGRSPARRA